MLLVFASGCELKPLQASIFTWAFNSFNDVSDVFVEINEESETSMKDVHTDFSSCAPDVSSHLNLFCRFGGEAPERWYHEAQFPFTVFPVNYLQERKLKGQKNIDVSREAFMARLKSLKNKVCFNGKSSPSLQGMFEPDSLHC